MVCREGSLDLLGQCFGQTHNHPREVSTSLHCRITGINLKKQRKCLNKGHNKIAVKFIYEEVVSSILIGGNINNRKQPRNIVTVQYTYTPPPVKSPVPWVRLGRWRDLI